MNEILPVPSPSVEAKSLRDKLAYELRRAWSEPAAVLRMLPRRLVTERIEEICRTSIVVLAQIEDLISENRGGAGGSRSSRSPRDLKRKGSRTAGLGTLTRAGEDAIRRKRHALNIPGLQRVDTCAASSRPRPPIYFDVRRRGEAQPTQKRKIMSWRGPIIAKSLLLRACGVAAARGWFRNHHGQLNPQTRLPPITHVDRLYFEPLTLEDVLEVIERRSRGRHRAVRRADALKCRRTWEAARRRSSAVAGFESTWPRNRERFQVLSRISGSTSRNATRAHRRSGRRFGAARWVSPLGRPAVLRARRTPPWNGFQRGRPAPT